MMPIVTLSTFSNYSVMHMKVRAKTSVNWLKFGRNEMTGMGFAGQNDRLLLQSTHLTILLLYRITILLLSYVLHRSNYYTLL